MYLCTSGDSCGSHEPCWGPGMAADQKGPKLLPSLEPAAVQAGEVRFQTVQVPSTLPLSVHTETLCIHMHMYMHISKYIYIYVYIYTYIHIYICT